MTGGSSFLLTALILAASPAGDQPKGHSIKVLKVWASETPFQEENVKRKDDKDELKEFRKRLEQHTRKRHFKLEGRVLIREATPGEPFSFPLSKECRLLITPLKEKKEGQDQLTLQLSLFKKKEEKRKFKIRGFPLMYCTPIRQDSQELVVIIEKIDPPKTK